MINGYVKNMTHLWTHVMKRNVGPGAQIPIQELYEQYGARHGLEEGTEFIQWLKEVKLRDRDRWGIFTEDDQPHDKALEVKDSKAIKSVEKGLTKTEQVVERSRGDSPAPIVATEMAVDDVVELSVRKAREIIPQLHDIKLLKYAENAANQRPGKDSLRRILMRRISELETMNHM